MSPCDLPHGHQTIWTVDAHRNGKRFIVRSDEKLAALVGTGKGDARVHSELGLVMADQKRR